MPKGAYLKLSSSAKASWNKLDSEYKALILSSHKYKTARLPSKPPFSDSKPALAVAELHEILEAQHEHYDTNNPQDCETGECTRLANFSDSLFSSLIT